MRHNRDMSAMSAKWEALATLPACRPGTFNIIYNMGLCEVERALHDIEGDRLLRALKRTHHAPGDMQHKQLKSP